MVSALTAFESQYGLCANFPAIGTGLMTNVAPRFDRRLLKLYSSSPSRRLRLAIWGDRFVEGASARSLPRPASRSAPLRPGWSLAPAKSTPSSYKLAAPRNGR